MVSAAACYAAAAEPSSRSEEDLDVRFLQFEPRESGSVAAAAFKPLKSLEDHSPITQEELYLISKDFSQARPAVQPVLKAAAPSVEDSSKTQATQKFKYRSEDEEKNSSDDYEPLV
jgi:hypothetical protein